MITDCNSVAINDVSQNIMRATIQLAAFKARRSPLIEYMKKNIKKEVDIEEVRSRLAKISASMAEEITEDRAERL